MQLYHHSSRFDVGDYYPFHILDHGLLVWPVFGRACDVLVRQKLIVGMVVWGFGLVVDMD